MLLKYFIAEQTKIVWHLMFLLFSQQFFSQCCCTKRSTKKNFKVIFKLKNEYQLLNMIFLELWYVIFFVKAQCGRCPSKLLARTPLFIFMIVVVVVEDICKVCINETTRHFIPKQLMWWGVLCSVSHWSK